MNSYTDACPIAPIRTETRHVRVLDLLRAHQGADSGCTRAFDDAKGRTMGFFDVETGHLHYCPVTAFQMSPQEISKDLEAFAELGLDRQTLREGVSVPPGRRELFGSPTLARNPDGTWEDQS